MVAYYDHNSAGPIGQPPYKWVFSDCLQTGPRPHFHSLATVVHKEEAGDCLEDSLPAQVLSSAVEVSGFNPPRATGRRGVPGAAAASASKPRLRQRAKAHFRRAAAHSACRRPRLGPAAEAASGLRWLRALGGGDRGWAGTYFLYRRTTKQAGCRHRALGNGLGRRRSDGLRAEQR